MKRLLTLLCVLAFAAAPMAIASPAPPGSPTIILIGGSGDTDGSGIQWDLNSKGWIPKGVKPIKIPYLADMWQPDASTADATPKIVAAWQRYCSAGQKCEIHAVSLGTNPAARASRELGIPNGTTKVFLHASPAAITGTYHSLNPAFQAFGPPPSVLEYPTPGTEHWFSNDDYAANKAPQCFNSAAVTFMAIGFTQGAHVTLSKSTPNTMWVGPDGVVNHEANIAANPLTASGQSPDASCPDPWYR